jgi:trehalose synthase
MDGVGIEKYLDCAGAEVLANIQKAARKIYGLRVLHVNSTFHGGGVAMMLNCLIPLMNDVGINADWNLLYGDPSLFSITKKIHNGIQGEEVTLSQQELATARSFMMWSSSTIHNPSL